MKLSIVFAITLLLAVAFQLIASSSLAAKDSPTGPVFRLTLSQKDALKVLALEGETHKKVVGRADPSKVAKFIEIHELFKEGNVKSTWTDKGETFDFATAYVPCEIAWHLRIIAFDETIQCLEKSTSWKARTNVGDKVLVNFFADKHAFELIQLLKTTDVGDEELFLNVQKLLSSEGFFKDASSALFLQHALALYKEAPKSLERQQMVKNFLSLHLSAIVTLFKDQAMIKELYTELVQDIPTLLSGGSPEHVIAVVATCMKKDKYDIVIVNSGDGIENHESTTEIQPKGFHTGASYDYVPTDKTIEATSYNPLLRVKEVTGAQLSSANYHYGTMDQVYYVAKNASNSVLTEPLMPWEWTEKQGIGTCTAMSVWFALRYYYQALGYENDIRLSMLDQAIGDLKELQDTIEDLERKVNADYLIVWEAFKKTRKGKIDHFHYDQNRVKDLKLAKDEAGKSFHLRRTIISMALNEILRNLIVWKHELDDINKGLPIKCIHKGDVETVTKDKDDPKKAVQYRKMEQRQKVLEEAIPQAIKSFHSFWALQEEKYLKRQSEIVDTEAALLSNVLDSWHAIREDVRTLYNDAIRVSEIKPKAETALAKKDIVKAYKPIDVESLKKHESLSKILDYILSFGDSPALHNAISRHFETHTENANAAKYLIVLYACLARNVPLLDHLVVAKELPLRYKIDAAVRDTSVSMHWDLTTEDRIAALAAYGFAKYGQPLDAFPELFRMPQKETQGIVDKFKDAYKEIAPIINAKAPSQEDVDEAFEALVVDDVVSAMACILPKTSREAISDAFFETDSVRVLRLLIDSVQYPQLLEQKIEANLTNVEIVQLVLPAYLRSQRHAIEKDLIEKQRLGQTVIDEPAKAGLPDQWLKGAYAKNAVEVVTLLAQFTNKKIVRDLLFAAAKSRKFEMMLVLSSYATGAVFAAFEEAKPADSKPTETLFVEAVEKDDSSEFEKLMPDVSADTIGYALSKAAEKGRMSCFEKLTPHSTTECISAALSNVSDENLKHPSVLKAVSKVPESWAFREIMRRAIKTSSVELLAHMLPFMSTMEIDHSFISSCKNEESFETTKQLFKFAKYVNVSKRLKAAVNGKMESQVALLLPHVKREGLVDISQSSKFSKLSNGTQQAIKKRIKNFPTEIAIELAFLPKNGDAIRTSLQAELGKDDLACNDQETCIAKVGKDPTAVTFPVEQAIDRLLERTEDSAALEKLAPFATPYACTRIMMYFYWHGSTEALKVCAKKLLKGEVAAIVRSLQSRKNFELMKSLVPFLSPLGIVELLEPSSSSEHVDAVHLKDILADLPSALADDALRVAVRGNEEKREKSVHDLLPKASPATIDEVYLFAKRIKFEDVLLEKAASGKAKDREKGIEGRKDTPPLLPLTPPEPPKPSSHTPSSSNSGGRDDDSSHSSVSPVKVEPSPPIPEPIKEPTPEQPVKPNESSPPIPEPITEPTPEQPVKPEESSKLWLWIFISVLAALLILGVAGRTRF